MSSTPRSSKDAPPLLTPATTVVMDSAELGAAAVRIPALLHCSSGRLVAFAEFRRDDPGDTGPIHVVARVRGEDGQWGTAQVVAQAAGRTMGNPAPLEADDGSIVLLTTSNDAQVTEAAILSGTVPAPQGRRVHLTRLRCTGTELDPIGPTQDITEQAKDPRWGWYATGPGHGVRLPSGRMVVAANHSAPKATGGSSYGAHGLVSEDEGHTWRIGWVVDEVVGISGPNESAVAHAQDTEGGVETVLMTSRNEATDQEPTRIIGRVPLPDVSRSAVPRSAGFSVLNGFDGPRIQCGIASLSPGHGVSHVLTGPLHPEARRDLALHAVDAGSCSPLGLLRAGPAGYSDVAVDDRNIFVLVETGEHRIHERIELLSIDVAEATAASHSLKEQMA